MERTDKDIYNSFVDKRVLKRQSLVFERSLGQGVDTPGLLSVAGVKVLTFENWLKFLLIGLTDISLHSFLVGKIIIPRGMEIPLGIPTR